MQTRRFPVAVEGLPYIAGFFAGGVFLSLLAHPVFHFLAFLFFALTLFCLFFFRDPERVIPQDPSFVLSPGDGLVMEVSDEKTPYGPEPMTVIKIFLSVFDVHIQRSPVAGIVRSTEHRPGKFLDARNRAACLENESNTIIIENAAGKVAVKQIAGLIARRIRCWVQPGQTVSAGERIGLIQFGSQVDLFLEKGFEICVKKGDRVTGARTVLAMRRKPSPKSGSLASNEVRS